MGTEDCRVCLYETILNLEMSGFLYTSMISLAHAHAHTLTHTQRIRHGQWECVGTFLRPIGTFSSITFFKGMFP